MGVTKGARWPAEVTALAARVAEVEEQNAALTKRLARLEARVRKVEKPESE
jgi:ubiquinone biosynthesis protein UbiJ